MHEHKNTFPDEWRCIVNSWAGMHESLTERFSGRIGAHLELSNTALFSAAAWRCGVIAVNEVNIARRVQLQRAGKIRNSYGRYDLALGMSSGTHLIEAKHRTVGLPVSGGYTKYFKALRRDCQSCKRSAKLKKLSIVGLLFFTGYLPSRQAEQGHGCNIVATEVQRFKADDDKVRSGSFVQFGSALFEERKHLQASRLSEYLTLPVLFGIKAFRFK